MNYADRMLRFTALLCCVALLCLWLVGCDSSTGLATSVPTPISITTAANTAASPSSAATATAVRGTAAATVSAQRAVDTPAAVPCVMGAASGQVPLLPLPAAVRGPIGLAMLQGRVIVAGRRSGNLGVIENNQLQTVIPAGASTAAIAADDTLGALFVLDDRSGQVALYKDAKLQATLPITDSSKPGYGSASVFLVDAPSHRMFIALDASPPEIVIVDTQTFKVTNRLSPPGVMHVGKMTLDAQNNRLWFSQFDSVSALDLNSGALINSITLPGSTYGVLLYDPQSRRLYADYYSAGSHLAVIENGRQTDSLIVGEDPADAVIAGTQLYVSNSYSNTVSVIDIPSSRVVGSIPVGVAPRTLLVDPQGSRLYVAVSGGYTNEVNRLDIIDTARNVVSGFVPLSANATQMLADNTRQRLYILMPSSKELLISDGKQVLSRIPLELGAQQMALDEAAGRLYITDYLSQHLSVVDVTAASVIERPLVNLAGPLNAVAVDKLKGRLVINNWTFAPAPLSASGHFTLTELTLLYGDGNVADHLYANPSVPRIYAVGSNGIPGSNGGIILYVVDGDSLQQIGIAPENNVSAVVLDNTAQRVYLSTTHPLGGYTRLSVLDALALKPIARLDLPAHVSAMALNEQTHHLFLTYHAYYANPSPFDNIMQVLDTRTLGTVISTTVVSEPSVLAVLGDRTFVAGDTANALAVYRDCQADAPTAPTPTLTSTPYPTYPPAPTFTPTRAPARATATLPPPAPTVSSLARCELPDAGWLQQWFSRDTSLRAIRDSLGCPVSPPRPVQIAVQPFTHGLMVWRSDTHRIMVAVANGSWAEYDDTWDASQPEGGTERPPAGLIAPKRGFGKVWREKLGGPAAVIGWATQDERGVASEMQDFPSATAYKDLGVGNGLFFRNGNWR